MWIQESKAINERLISLGEYDNHMYLLKGRDAMLIGGGMSWIVPELDKQLEKLHIDPLTLKYLAISHSHFDHCGAVPYLKHKYPFLQVISSAKAKDILSSEKAIKFIASANDRMVDIKGVRADYERLHLRIDAIHVDCAVADNDSIDLGDGIEARFIATPGHTECSISVYIPLLNTLFPGDAAPLLGDSMGKYSYPSPQYSYSSYKESLKKLAAYDVEAIAYEHHGVTTSEHAHKAISIGLALTEEFGHYVVNLHHEYGGDIDKLAAQIADESHNLSKLGHLDKDMRFVVARTICRRVLKDAGIEI